MVCRASQRRDRGCVGGGGDGASWVVGRPYAKQIAEVWRDGSWGAGAREAAGGHVVVHDVGVAATVGDQTVVIFFLYPLVDDGAGPNVIHVGAKNGVLIGKETRLRDDAAGFRHEDGYGVIRSLVKNGNVAAGLK